MPTSADERFHSKYTITEAGCWEWTGVRNRDGYGSFWTGERFPGRDGKRGGPVMVLAHRWSHERFVSEIPSGLYVLHTCDTPCCVNPEHLFLGTQADNVRDCAAKGRRNQRHLHKLTEAQIEEIRERYTGEYGQLAALGREFGVAYTTIKHHLQR